MAAAMACARCHWVKPLCSLRLQSFKNIFSNANILQRHKSTTANLPKVNLWEEYQRTKAAVEVLVPTKEVDATSIFANNELDLSEIDIYGFDYDYTLALYKRALHHLIYDLGRENLIKKYKYPSDIESKYDTKFAIRGLHYDVQKGLLMKIDAFHHIQMGTVYRGRRAVRKEEVLSLYQGDHVPITYMSSFHGVGPNMYQLMDLFALPEITLLSNVTEYFNQNNIAYDPEYVFYDVRNAVQGIHSSGLMHSRIMENMDAYLVNTKGMSALLHRLNSAGKRLFLITNSGFPFVNKGMTYIIGPDWQDLFEVVVVNARKPKFFNDTSRPFRTYKKDTETKSWDRVNVLRKGEIYQEGNLYQFGQLTNWFGSKVLYFGDHVYSDLADPTLKHGWRTGAIIPELEDEIAVINSAKHKLSATWLSALHGLIDKMQVYEDAESQQILAAWVKEREEVRYSLKMMCNERFGSVFRTHNNPTYFSRRLHRFANIYMSSVTNLNDYSLNHTFYPRRAALPHEIPYVLPH